MRFSMLQGLNYGSVMFRFELCLSSEQHNVPAVPLTHHMCQLSHSLLPIPASCFTQSSLAVVNVANTCCCFCNHRIELQSELKPSFLQLALLNSSIYAQTFIRLLLIWSNATDNPTKHFKSYKSYNDVNTNM